MIINLPKWNPSEPVWTKTDWISIIDTSKQSCISWILDHFHIRFVNEITVIDVSIISLFKGQSDIGYWHNLVIPCAIVWHPPYENILRGHIGQGCEDSSSLNFQMTNHNCCNQRLFWGYEVRRLPTWKLFFFIIIWIFWILPQWEAWIQLLVQEHHHFVELFLWYKVRQILMSSPNWQDQHQLRHHPLLSYLDHRQNAGYFVWVQISHWNIT